jgi:hypothetical protein
VHIFLFLFDDLVVTLFVVSVLRREFWRGEDLEQVNSI